MVSLTPRRNTDSRLWLFEIDGVRWVVKSFLNEDALLRRDLELARLLRWAEHGFPVPAARDSGLEDLSDPYLLIAYIDGRLLRDYLRDATVTPKDKLDLLRAILTENARRHAQALETSDHLLIHTDPNTDNIILTAQGNYHIDFEHPGKKLAVDLMAAKEIAAFIRKAASDLGTRHLEELASIAAQAYRKHPELLVLAGNLTLARPYQWMHRVKDRFLKLRQPELVTRYDVADRLTEAASNVRKA